MKTGSAALAVLALAVAPQAASAGVFGTNPVNISVGPGGQDPNGPSGHPSISGDDRKGSLTAFDSQATNLVSGDNNGVSDVFVWHRPLTAPGQQETLGSGSLDLVSAGANGPSSNPSVDGSTKRSPHCVAFESKATNLDPADTTPDSDIYVRDLRGKQSKLVSGGASGEATDPSIEGDCSRVAFAAGGSIWIGTPKGGNAKKFAPGSSPDISLDGTAVAWVQGGSVKAELNGKKTTMGRGNHPIASDHDSNGWMVGFEGGSGIFKAISKGKGVKRDLFPGSLLAGVSAFAATRGIVTYANGATLFYLNLHSGNSDDLAVSQGAITEAAAGARGNFVAFTSAGGQDFVGPSGQPSVWFKSLRQ